MDTPAYKPRIAYQGSFMVSPDGKLHSPMVEIIGSLKSLLLIPEDDITADGVRRAIAVARKHLPLRKDDMQLRWHLNQVHGVLVAEELQQQGLLSRNIPPLAETRAALGDIATAALLSKHYPQSDNDHDPSSKINAAFNGRLHISEHRAKLLRREFYRIFGADPAGAENGTPNQPLVPGQQIITETLGTTLDAMERDAEGLASRLQEQRQHYAENWKHRIARIASWLSNHQVKSGISVIAVSSLSRVANSALQGLGVTDHATATLLDNIIRGTMLATIPPITGMKVIERLIRNRLDHSPTYGDRLKRSLEKQLTQAVADLPERTRVLLAHYDPTFFIADNAEHLQRGLEKGAIFASTAGCSCEESQLLFIHRDHLRDKHTFFEEATHLLQSNLLSYVQQADFGIRYKHDMQIPQAERFLKNTLLSRVTKYTTLKSYLP